MERAFAELVRRGSHAVRFVVVSCSLAEDLRPLVEWSRVRIPQRPAALRFTAYWFVAGHRLRRLRRDAAVVHTLGAIVPNRIDVASVHHCHHGSLAAMGLTPAQAPPLRRVNTAIARLLALAAERWCYRPERVRVLAAVSRTTCAEVVRHFPGVAATVTPNGVSIPALRPDAPELASARRELGTAPGALAVLFVGGNWDLKGLRIAIEGVVRARAAGAPVELFVIGRGDEQRFRRLAGNDAVHFLGPRPETAPYFAAADAFVLPSLYETFSLVAHEAAAAGLPIVATSVGGVTELVGDDEAGLLVERSADAIADALARLASEPDLCARLGAEGRRRAQALGWGQAVEAVLAVYRRLLSDADAAEAA